MAQHDTPLPRPVDGAIFKKLPEGGVLFSTETEVYFGVGEVGARIWELLPPANRTVEEMVSILAGRYRDVRASQIRADVDRFLGELLENGLVKPVQSDTQRDRAIP
ncbi:MAG TPA: PqqD family protein [Gemmatimonadaceae bacterium]